MKIAVIYNRESKNVINLFGIPNREKYGQHTIKIIVDALKKGGHQVVTFEGDKQIIDKLERFMPRVVKGERPGMVFNLSYGIQGKARYTHIPSILEMVGIPYVGSNPLAHSLALDKVVTKIILRQNGLPTPDFAVLQDKDFKMPDLLFPLIVKPKSEAVSFGIQIVNSEKELREAAEHIFTKFMQPVLVERYINGREINVGLLGNDPAETLPPVEIIFGEGGPPIFTHEDKIHRTEREIRFECPAKISQTLTEQAQDLAKKAFAALGCYDCARVDMRLDKSGNLHILEVNSLPSLGPGGSYVYASRLVGLDYAALVNRLVEIASSRYFGTPTPPKLEEKKLESAEDIAFSFLIQKRDQIERKLQHWCSISSRTYDPVGKRLAAQELDSVMEDLNLHLVKHLSDSRSHWLWATKKGFEKGVLLITHLDVLNAAETPAQIFRRDPEFLYGEGIGSSRASLVMAEFAMRALRVQKLLRKMHLGFLCYADEGVDVNYSANAINQIASKAGKVLVLNPGNTGGKIMAQRRGQIKYHLAVEGKSLKLGQITKNPQVLLWSSNKLKEISALTSKKEKIAVAATNLKVESFPMFLPHRLTATLILSYYDEGILKKVKNKIDKLLAVKGLHVSLEEISARPPMKERSANRRFIRTFQEIAKKWEIPFEITSSLWPSVAGLVPASTPVLCGMGPIAEDLHTPQERIQRISLVQRTLLLTQYLIYCLEKQNV